MGLDVGIAYHAIRKSVRFFTFPPKGVEYPFILLNATSFKSQIKSIAERKNDVLAIIIDSGIEIFRNKNVREYPGGAEAAIRRQVKMYIRTKKLFHSTDVYAIIPDYPDDYHPRNLWLNKRVTNIERTYNNVIRAIDEYPDINWLIPVQGHYGDPESIRKSIELYESHGILDRYDYFAIANIFNSRKKKYIVEVLTIAREFLKNKKIHFFGIGIYAVSEAHKHGLLDSFDTLAWTRPTKLSQKAIRARKRWSCKNSLERKIYFYAWLITLIKKYNTNLEQVNVKEIKRKLDYLSDLYAEYKLQNGNGFKKSVH